MASRSVSDSAPRADDIGNSTLLEVPRGTHSATYVGGVADGKPQGDGKIIYANIESSDRRTCHREIDIRIHLLDTNMSFVTTTHYPYVGEYVGKFDKGKRHGQGTHKYPDGCEFTGEFVSDMRHGPGNLKWLDNSSFVGNYRNGKRDGQGTHKYADGCEFTGKYVSGLRHGPGILKWLDNSSFVGNYRNGKRHGQGKRTWLSNGSSYDGEYRNGKRHGIGILVSSNGNTYVGQFINGGRHGLGMNRYNDHRTRVGWFLGGPRDRGFVWKRTQRPSNRRTAMEWLKILDEVRPVVARCVDESFTAHLDAIQSNVRHFVLRRRRGRRRNATMTTRTP